jgi:hypothetical protein
LIDSQINEAEQKRFAAGGSSDIATEKKRREKGMLLPSLDYVRGWSLLKSASPGLDPENF